MINFENIGCKATIKIVSKLITRNATIKILTKLLNLDYIIVSQLVSMFMQRFHVNRANK